MPAKKKTEEVVETIADLESPEEIELVEGVTTYEIVMANERVRITIPSSYKVTYGLLHPGTKGGWGGNQGYVLRIYESDTKQRAVFQNVLSFRDMSLPLERLNVAKEKHENTHTFNGLTQHALNQFEEATWLNAE